MSIYVLKSWEKGCEKIISAGEVNIVRAGVILRGEGPLRHEEPYLFALPANLPHSLLFPSVYQIR